jgi:hypothetical protein
MRVTTTSGREIRMANIEVTDAFEHTLEGSDEGISRLRRRNTDIKLGRVRDSHYGGYLALDPGLPVLPQYTCEASLKSSRLNAANHHSELFLIWYVAEIDSLRSAIADALESFAWEEHAKDLTVDDL